MDWETTTIMLERLRDSDGDAWDRFASRFTPPLVRFGMRFGLSQSQAEDAAQDAMVSFVEAYRAGRYDRERGRLSSWLFALAFNAIRSHRRDERRAPAQGPLGDPGRTTFFSALPDEAEAEKAWELDWEHHVLTECLARLRGEIEKHTYEAFELVSLKQMAPAAVAERLGISRDSVYQAKLRALRRLGELRAELEQVGNKP